MSEKIISGKEFYGVDEGVRKVKGIGKKCVLGIQHTFTMFGATILVPIITGLDISVTLFMAGVSTILFHLITKKKVPVFLGSSFAFIAPMLSVLLLKTGANNVDQALASPLAADGLAYARGGIVVAGLVYLVLALLMYMFDTEKILSFFPPIVTGPIILVIGLKLAPVAINMASGNWGLAIVSFSIVLLVSMYGKGFLKILPIMMGLIGGYIVAIITDNVDFTTISQAQWYGMPHFTMAKFDFTSIMIIVPVALATMIEHVGDVIAIGETVDKNFIKEPGLHRTLLGDGIATAVSAMVGGPANTTYSENTGVLALTKVWDPAIMRIAAVFAIILGIVPKLGGIIRTIPTSIVGGISIILFGMIASIGIKTMVENKIDFNNSKNLIISAVILVLGLGGAVVPINFGTVSFTIEGLALASIIGIVLNKILPERI